MKCVSEREGEMHGTIFVCRRRILCSDAQRDIDRTDFLCNSNCENHGYSYKERLSTALFMYKDSHVNKSTNASHGHRFPYFFAHREPKHTWGQALTFALMDELLT
jgi:hypothetical protein